MHTFMHMHIYTHKHAGKHSHTHTRIQPGEQNMHAQSRSNNTAKKYTFSNVNTPRPILDKLSELFKSFNSIGLMIILPSIKISKYIIIIIFLDP